jgi:hypothetical protein
VAVPGRIAANNRKLIHVEKDTLHKPLWTESGLKWIYGKGQNYNWTRNYAMHLWYRKHNIDYNPKSIRSLKNTLGGIFRFIYYGSAGLMNT